MQNANDAISNFNDLQQQVLVLEQSIRKLLEYQNELSVQIDRLTGVKIKNIVSEVIRELNKVERTNITSFDDLLLLNAKRQIKKAIKAI